MKFIKLIEFVTKNGNDLRAVSELITEFETRANPSPIFHNNPYVAECYKQRRDSATLGNVFGTLVEKILYPIYLESLNYSYIERIFGCRLNSSRNAQISYLFGRAATYKLVQIGELLLYGWLCGVSLSEDFIKKWC